MEPMRDCRREPACFSRCRRPGAGNGPCSPRHLSRPAGRTSGADGQGDEREIQGNIGRRPGGVRHALLAVPRSTRESGPALAGDKS